MVPLIQDEIVDKRKWIDKEDFIDLLGLLYFQRRAGKPSTACHRISLYKRIRRKRTEGDKEK